MFLEVWVLFYLELEFGGIDVELPHKSFEALLDVLDLDLLHVLKLQVCTVHHVFVQDPEEEVVLSLLEERACLFLSFYQLFYSFELAVESVVEGFIFLVGKR